MGRYVWVVSEENDGGQLGSAILKAPLWLQLGLRGHYGRRVRSEDFSQLGLTHLCFTTGSSHSVLTLVSHCSDLRTTVQPFQVEATLSTFKISALSPYVEFKVF